MSGVPIKERSPWRLLRDLPLASDIAFCHGCGRAAPSWPSGWGFVWRWRGDRRRLTLLCPACLKGNARDAFA